MLDPAAERARLVGGVKSCCLLGSLRSSDQSNCPTLLLCRFGLAPFSTVFPGLFRIGRKRSLFGHFLRDLFSTCTTDILKTYDNYFNNHPTLIFTVETDFYQSAKSAPNMYSVVS